MHGKHISSGQAIMQYSICARDSQWKLLYGMREGVTGQRSNVHQKCSLLDHGHNKLHHQTEICLEIIILLFLISNNNNMSATRFWKRWMLLVSRSIRKSLPVRLWMGTCSRFLTTISCPLNWGWSPDCTESGSWKWRNQCNTVMKKW